jgi:hypothetical protein
MGDPAHIPFPTFLRYRTREALPLCAVLIMTAALLYPLWRVPGQLCAAAAACIIAPRLLKDMRNAWIRRCWLRQFKRRISEIEIVPLISQHPERYAAHVRGYTGFDLNLIKPLAFLEDRNTGECIVISPSSWHLIETIIATGIPCTSH